MATQSEAPEDFQALGGRHFARVMRAGTLAVMRSQEELNRINVFPVPDADTGANLAATFRAAASRLGDDVPESVGAAARVAADGARDGARGNSGAIVAQFLHGLAAAFDTAAHVSTAEFALATQRGMESAYAALANPREGTILSVLRVWAHALRERAASASGFTQLLHHGLQAARDALANTPRQLEILARSHVVDAGGQGFVYFLEGVSEMLLGGKEPEELFVEPAPRGVASMTRAHAEADERFRFCAEALVSAAGRGVNRSALVAAISDLGESLVVAGGEDRLRVHVHTNEPQRFLEAVAAFGVIESSKVDDMVLQQISAREASIALVADSTCELPERRAFELGLVTVPLTISFGEQSYLDGVDISADGFARRLRESPLLPTSSQPPVGDFRETYQRLLEYRDGVVSVHIAAAQSGTWQAAAAAARAVDPVRVRAIDSRTNSVGTGLLLEALGEGIAGGADLDALESLANTVRDDITVFGTVQTLEYAVRGGRVSPRAAGVIDALRLKPLIVFDRMGKPGKGGVAVGFRRALHALASRVDKFAAGAPVRLMIVHSGAGEWPDYLAQELRRLFGVAEVPIVRAGPVLMAHVGPGSVSVGVRRLRAPSA